MLPLSLSKLCRIAFSSASTKDDFNFLQRSIMPTDHFQKSLPRLPVPKLEDSCRRYLKALEPVLTADDWQKTSKIVAKFQEGEGKGIYYSSYFS